MRPIGQRVDMQVNFTADSRSSYCFIHVSCSVYPKATLNDPAGGIESVSWTDGAGTLTCRSMRLKKKVHRFSGPAISSPSHVQPKNTLYAPFLSVSGPKHDRCSVPFHHMEHWAVRECPGYARDTSHQFRHLAVCIESLGTWGVHFKGMGWGYRDHAQFIRRAQTSLPTALTGDHRACRVQASRFGWY